MNELLKSWFRISYWKGIKNISENRKVSRFSFPVGERRNKMKWFKKLSAAKKTLLTKICLMREISSAQKYLTTGIKINESAAGKESVFYLAGSFFSIRFHSISSSFLLAFSLISSSEFRLFVIKKSELIYFVVLTSLTTCS